MFLYWETPREPDTPRDPETDQPLPWPEDPTDSSKPMTPPEGKPQAGKNVSAEGFFYRPSITAEIADTIYFKVNALAPNYPTPARDTPEDVITSTYANGFKLYGAETGGTGRTILYIVVGLVILGTIVFLINRRKNLNKSYRCQAPIIDKKPKQLDTIPN